MKKVNYVCILALLILSCKSTKDLTKIDSIQKDDGYVNLYNGKNLDDWNIMCRNSNVELAKKVFTAGENGEMHVFKDFPDMYGFVENRNETHGMFFTHKKYSRYVFKFDYKWGTKKTNNFDEFQYDAGMYFHVFDAKVWPKGIEYQVRYNHLENRNHTGDVWNSGAKFDWTASEDKTYLSIKDGGIPQEHKGGEHRAHKDAPFHALDGQWNECEVIVMGDKYAIFKLNGTVVNVLLNLNLKEGVVGLQAETAEIFYRNIKIKEFTEDIPISKFLK